MEPEVQEAPTLPRSELDAAFDVCRTGGWMVVQGMSATPWGYDVYPIGGESFQLARCGLSVAVELP